MTNHKNTSTNNQKSRKKAENFIRALADQQTSEIRELSNDIDSSSSEYQDFLKRVFGEHLQSTTHNQVNCNAANDGLQYLKIFDADSLKELSNRTTVGREERKFYDSLQSIPSQKPLKEANFSVINNIELLFELYPNAIELLRYIHDFLHLRRLAKTDKAIYMPPICISGPPGIGKTAVIKAICKALEVDYEFYDFSSTSSSWGLIGHDSGWSSSHPGLVLKTLIYGTCGNPILHLDEIDKAMVNHNMDPYGCLHTLLERPQMYRFVDAYAQNLPLAGQYVMFLATANDVNAIPPTIRSRLRIIDMQAPSCEEMRKISHNVYRTLLTREDVEESFEENLSDDVVDFLSTKTPREATLILARSLASAAARPPKIDRHAISIGDCTNLFSEQNDEQRRIGFVW
ncbi:AAA family ATPase [Methylomonas montana]|uniref:AAA family ATPase n=1 Tax=Methylomonas montana TaxID=3058963 RepID=UPI00265A6C21|nr:AAA family ATPase [Methylomonas montana]WKJ88601.1 AAA family ATPase [Methylomonas montana]